MLTDKLHGKRLAAAALGDSSVIPTLWLGRELPAAPPWPMPFIVKADHGCGQYVVVRDAVDYDRARRQAPGWLRRTYGAWLDEWHYRGARRLLLVEPYVRAIDALPLDYKIYVFGSRAGLVQLHEGRGLAHRWSQYDCRWRPLSTGANVAPPPASLAEMIAAAERLSKGHDFLRVDFYEVDGRPLFGESCLYPVGVLTRSIRSVSSEWLGAQWSAQ